MNKILLEEKLSNVRLSYNRQLSLCGNRGYDPKLTFDLKKDIEWFEQEKRYLETKPSSAGNKDC